MPVTKSRASEKIGEREVRSIVIPISLLMASSRLSITETRIGSMTSRPVAAGFARAAFAGAVFCPLLQAFSPHTGFRAAAGFLLAEAAFCSAAGLRAAAAVSFWFSRSWSGSSAQCLAQPVGVLPLGVHQVVAEIITQEVEVRGITIEVVGCTTTAGPGTRLPGSSARPSYTGTSRKRPSK
jgi:hypothetical protein